MKMKTTTEDITDMNYLKKKSVFKLLSYDYQVCHISWIYYWKIPRLQQYPDEITRVFIIF